MERTLPRTPRNTRRRASLALALLCTLALAASPSLFPGAHADDLKNKKHKVAQSIKGAQADVEDSSRALVAATARLQAAQARLVPAERALAATRGRLAAAQVLDAQMQTRLNAAEAALVAAEGAVQNGIAQVTAQRAAIGRLAAANYQYGDPALMGLSVMLTSQDPAALTTQMNTIDNLMGREAALLDRLKATEALLRVQKQKVEATKGEVEQQRQAAAVNLARRKVLEKQAAANAATVAQLVSAREQAAAQARLYRARDLRKLRQLKKEDARIEALILARARHEKGGYSGGAGGFLLRPLPGPITSPYGWRRHPIYGYWGLHDGDDFGSPCGTPERAAASGTVISEYYSDVWGNRLFIDVGRVNGKVMTLIYNHIERYRVGTGARVARGEVVAYEGTTGWSTGCHLHFTVMMNGVAVNPANYF